MGASEVGGVILDIGGDVGAAIVRTPAALLGSEIEIRRRGDPWEGKHTAVRARLLADGPLYAALFEGLSCGTYDLRVRHACSADPVASLVVEGGKVSESVLDGG